MSTPVHAENVSRVLFCSGKIYYELKTAREKAGISDMAIVRVEQLYPFPYLDLEAVVKNYPNASRCAWIQDEPRNQGAWTYIFNYWAGGVFNFHEKVQHLPLRYIGRDIHPTPAVGSHKRHEQEQKAIIEAAMSF